MHINTPIISVIYGRRLRIFAPPTLNLIFSAPSQTKRRWIQHTCRKTKISQRARGCHQMKGGFRGKFYSLSKCSSLNCCLGVSLMISAGSGGASTGLTNTLWILTPFSAFDCDISWVRISRKNWSLCLVPAFWYLCLQITRLKENYFCAPFITSTY